MPARSPRRRALRRTAVLVPVATLALAAPAGASSWSSPVPVPDGAVGAPATSALRAGATAVQAADGTTWVAWTQSVGASADTVRVARRTPDGAWSAAETVATRPRADGETGTRLRGPAIDLTPGGAPVVLWSQATDTGDEFGVRAARRGGDGAWSTPAELGPESFGSGAFDSSLAVHHVADGRTVAAWRAGTTVRAAVLGPDGTWSATATLGDDLQGTEVDVASDAEGRITVIWAGADGAVARTRSESGSWGAAQAVGPDAASTPRVAADAQGDLVAVWASADDDTGDGEVQVARRGASDAAWTVEPLAAAGAPSRVAPDVALDRHGDATVVWSTTVADGEGAEAGAVVRSRVRRPDGSWDAPQDVYASPATEGPAAPRIVSGHAGTATVVWTDARFGSPRFARLSAATRAGLGADWSGATPLSDAANGFTSVPDNVTADALGNVALALTPLMSAVVANATPPVLRELDAAPTVGTDWSARWLPGSMNLRTFVNYLYGFDGGVATSDGATRPEPLDRFGYRLTVADAWRDVDTGETVVEHRGTVRMTSPPHFIDIRILDPTVRIAADGRSGRIVASGQGSGPMNPGATEPSLEPFTDATLVDLDLTAGAVRTGDGGRVRTYVGVPGRIAGGDAERYLAYPSGTAYGTFTVTIPAAVPDRDPTPDGGGAGGGAGGGTGGGTPVAPGPGTPPGPPITAAPPKTPGGAAAKRVTARVVGPRGARRTVTLTTATRIGASGSRSYRVRLVRRGRTVATGTLKGRRLRVVVRSTGRTKGGRARYPRLTGAYVLRAQGGAAKHRIPATTLRVR